MQVSFIANEKINTKLTDLSGSVRNSNVILDYSDKNIENSINPNKIYERTYFELKSPDDFLDVSMNEITQAWYEFAKYDDENTMQLKTFGLGANQRKYVMYEFNIVGGLKNKININSNISGIKQDVASISLRLYGMARGYNDGVLDATWLLNVWNPVTLTWDSIGEYSGYQTVISNISSEYIGNNGKIYFIIYSKYPSTETGVAETALGYAGLTINILDRRIGVDFYNSEEKPIFTQSTINADSLVSAKSGKSKEILLSEANGRFNMTPALLHTRSGKMITVWREGAIHNQDTDSIVRMKISRDHGMTWEEKTHSLNKIDEDQRDFFLFQESRIGRIFLGGFSWYMDTTYKVKPILFYSDDDGETWTEIDINTQLGGVYAPLSRRMIQDYKGDLYLFAYTDKDLGTRGITMTKSTDTGLTWSALKEIIPAEMIFGVGQTAYGLSEAMMEYVPTRDRIVGVLRTDDSRASSPVVYSDDYGETWEVMSRGIGFNAHAGDLIIGDNDSLILLYRNGGKETNIRVTYDDGITWSKPLITLQYRSGGYGQLALIAPNLYGVTFDQLIYDTVSDVFFNYVSIPYEEAKLSNKILSVWNTSIMLDFDYLSFGHNYATGIIQVRAIDVANTTNRIFIVNNLHDADMDIEINAMIEDGVILYPITPARVTIPAGEKKVLTGVDLPLLNEPYTKLSWRILKSTTRPTSGSIEMTVLGY